jgi:hypothetical protein
MADMKNYHRLFPDYEQRPVAPLPTINGTEGDLTVGLNLLYSGRLA